MTDAESSQQPPQIPPLYRALLTALSLGMLVALVFIVVPEVLAL